MKFPTNIVVTISEITEPKLVSVKKDKQEGKKFITEPATYILF